MSNTLPSSSFSSYHGPKKNFIHHVLLTTLLSQPSAKHQIRFSDLSKRLKIRWSCHEKAADNVHVKHDSGWSPARDGLYPEEARLRARSRGDLRMGAQNEPRGLILGLGHAEKHPWVMSQRAEAQAL